MGSSQSTGSTGKEEVSSGLHLVEIDASSNKSGKGQSCNDGCSIGDLVSFEVGVAVFTAAIVLLMLFRKRICQHRYASQDVLPYHVPMQQFPAQMNPGLYLPPPTPAYPAVQPSFNPGYYPQAPSAPAIAGPVNSGSENSSTFPASAKIPAGRK